MMAFMAPFYASEGITHLLLLALQRLMISDLLNNSLPCFFIYSHLTPILNLHFSQILSDITLPSYPQSTIPPYCNLFPSVILF